MRDRPISEYGQGEFPPLPSEREAIRAAKGPTPREVALEEAGKWLNAAAGTNPHAHPETFDKACRLADLYIRYVELIR